MKLNSEKIMRQAEQILSEAKKQNVRTDFFFRTTFHRYLAQLNILRGLEKEIQKTGLTVRKEYVKGRQNVYTNPAITEYNKTVSAANGTVGTLINIIRSLEERDPTAGGKLRSLLESIGSDDE